MRRRQTGARQPDPWQVLRDRRDARREAMADGTATPDPRPRRYVVDTDTQARAARSDEARTPPLVGDRLA